MLTLLYSVFGLIFVITLIVLFHEAGHYFTARAAGVGVTEFAIGMGKRLFGFRRGSTEYNIRAIPIGGFVDLIGMEENPEATPEERALEFAGKSAAWRIAILFAGSFMNFVLAFLLFALINGFFGQQINPLAGMPVVAHVMDASPAAQAGLLPGDRLLAVDGTPVRGWNAFRDAIEARPGRRTAIAIRRDSVEISVEVTPIPDDQAGGKGRIGVVSALAPVFGDIHAESPVWRAGVRPGDRIVSAGGEPVRMFEDFRDAVGRAAKGPKVLVFTVDRGTGEIEYSVECAVGEIGVRPPYAALVGGTAPGGPAERAGIGAGDRIATVDGVEVLSWHHMVNLFSGAAGRTLEVEVEASGGGYRTVALQPRDAGDGVGRIGIMIKQEYDAPIGIVRGTALAFHQTVDLTEKTVVGIWNLIIGALAFDNVSGPVGIAKIVGGQAREGFVALLGVTAILSINIGLINLFPIPGLDGSRILFVLIEIIRRRKLSARVEEAIHAAGLTLLILLLILVTWKDVMKLF